MVGSSVNKEQRFLEYVVVQSFSVCTVFVSGTAKSKSIWECTTIGSVTLLRRGACVWSILRRRVFADQQVCFEMCD